MYIRQEDIGSERIHSSSSGATRWANLLAQLRRYRDAAQSYTVAHALLTQPEVAAVVQGPPVRTLRNKSLFLGAHRAVICCSHLLQ